jgi:hypothetical protein
MSSHSPSCISHVCLQSPLPQLKYIWPSLGDDLAHRQNIDPYPQVILLCFTPCTCAQNLSMYALPNIYVGMSIHLHLSRLPAQFLHKTLILCDGLMTTPTQNPLSPSEDLKGMWYICAKLRGEFMFALWTARDASTVHLLQQLRRGISNT